MSFTELTAVLERVSAERGGVLGVLPGLVMEPDETWTPVAELVRAPYTLLGELVDQTADRWGAPRHVGGALFWKTFGYWHTVPMALGWALGRQVPIMRLADTYFKVSEAGVTLGASAVSVGSGADDIRQALLEGQEPVLGAISEMVRVGRRTLWGSTAEAFAHSMKNFVQADFMGLLAEIGRPVDGLVELTADGHRRRTCCLWITLPDVEACSTCCISI